MSTKTEKAVLFLVEGDTDEQSLAGVIRRYLAPRHQRFQVIGTDITSDWDINPKNILDRVNDEIHIALDKEKWFETDLSEVIQLVDMDGTYSDDRLIREEATIPHWQYHEDGMVAKSRDEAIKRNRHKVQNLDQLLTLTHVGKSATIPYRAFYFSCNLEHVLHNEPNVPDYEKREKADAFADQYYDDVEGFVRFITKSSFCVLGSWEQTWNFIKEGNHSLQRFTNFGLFFEKGGRGV